MQTIKAKGGGHLDKKNTVKTMMALLKKEIREFVIVIMIVNTLELWKDEYSVSEVICFCSIQSKKYT